MKNGNGKDNVTLYVQFSSVAQLCPTLCDPMNHSTPGLPVRHHLPEFFLRMQIWMHPPPAGNPYLSELQSVQFIQYRSRVQLFVTPWTAAHQASLSITNSQSLLKLMSVESVMPSNHLILCCPLLLMPSVFPSIRAFSNESTLHMRWPKYWSKRSINVY